MTENKKDTTISIVRYTQQHRTAWNTFVRESRNGTFLHMREYMEYHSNRFCDHSLLFTVDDGKRIAALLPANADGDTLSSHGGLTYGGLIISNHTTAEMVMQIFTLLAEYLACDTQIKKIIYRCIPHIYHKYPCDEDLYALFRMGATLVERKISSAVQIKNPIPTRGRRKLTATAKSRLGIIEDDNFAAFWEILTNRLQQKYGVSPVHTLNEITMLHSHFPQNIRLFRVTDEHGTTIAGTLIYLTDNVAHMQYIATTDTGRRAGALYHLCEYLIHERFTDIQYLDFGISTEQGGHYLNSGLITSKENLGGRAIMYDTYMIDIKKPLL